MPDLSHPPAPPPAADANGDNPWRLPRFRAYACMRFFWGASQEIMTVGLAWLIYARTHSTLALGMVGLASFLPSLLLSMVTGTVADRLDRRTIMRAASGTMALCGLTVCLLSFGDVIWPIYIVVVVQGISRAFAQPAAKAMLPNLAPPRILARVIAAGTLVQGTSTILGPALGGVLIPLGQWVPFAVCCGFACLALVGTLGLGPQRAKSAPRARPDMAMLLAGYRFIWSRPKILGAMGLDLVAVMFGSATALLPFYVTDVFHEGPWAMGALRASDAVGGLAMAAVLSQFHITRHFGPKLLTAVAVYGCATMAFGLSTNVYVGMFFLAVVGASDTISMVTRNSLIQINTPDGMQGRVAAVHSMATGTSNDLGEFESGLLAHAIGGVPAVVAGGAMAVLAAVGWAFMFPAVRKADRLDESLPED
ncbi:MAG: MFS transporter [Pseudomonadota bacterium]